MSLLPRITPAALSTAAMCLLTPLTVLAQRPPESVFIDTSHPTIVPPPMPAESAIPDVASPLQSYASIEPSRVVVGVDQRNPKKQNKTKIAAHKPPPVVVAANSPPPSVPPTRLSFLDVVSGMGRRLFNLR